MPESVSASGTSTDAHGGRVEGEDLAIGRIYSQAPDVDGLTVIMGRGMKSGDRVRVGITRVRGIDLEGVRID